MFSKHLNGRLIIAVIAVALSSSFYYEPSFARRILEGDHEIQIFEKIMKKEDDLNDKKMMELYTEMVFRNKDQDTTYWGSQGIGVVIGWRAAEFYGGRSILIHGNGLRLFGVLLHFGEFMYRTYYPLSASPSPVPLSAEEDAGRCGCIHIYFGEEEVSKETENSTNTTTNSARVTPAPLSSESETTQTNDKLREISKLDISLWSKCVHGVYSGMSTFMGILYLYEISPKGIRVHAVSVLALYYLVTTAIKYAVEIGIAPTVIYGSTADICSWGTSGILTIGAIVAQVVLLISFCPESPTFLFHQKKDKEKAKKVLIQLRQTDQVDQELELLEKKKGQRDPLIRSGLIMTMYMIYLVYNSTYIFLGILSAVSIGIPLNICVNIYYTVNILSFFLTLIFYKDLYLITIRNVLLYYYLFLGCIYFIIASLFSANVHYGPELFNNRQTLSVFVVAMTLFMHVLSSAGLGFFTIVLVNEYSSHKDRLWNITLSCVFGAFFAFGGLFIFLKGILIFYHFLPPIPWIFLGVLIGIVGKYEMTRFGLAPNNFEAFAVFDLCLKVQVAAPVKKEIKPEIKA